MLAFGSHVGVRVSHRDLDRDLEVCNLICKFDSPMLLSVTNHPSLTRSEAYYS